MIATVIGFINLSVVRSDSTTEVPIAKTNEVSEFVPLTYLKYKIENLKNQKEIQIKEDLRNNEIARVEAILNKFGSPFAGLGSIIVDKVQECGGGDFRTLLAIAGNESGFGRIPYKQYNPFGYLNGVTYSGWEESLAVLSCKITQQYLVPCNSSPECIVVKYAGDVDDRSQWVRNIYWFINQI